MAPHRLALVLSVFSLLACASDPSPQAAPTVQALAPTFAATSEASPQPPEPNWWRSLGDATLDRLVEAALDENRDLLAAEAEVRRARAIAGIEGWRQLPTAGVFAGNDRRRDAGDAADTTAASAGATIAWEIDVFARLRHGARAAGHEALSVEETRRGVQVAIAAETVVAYVTLRGAQARRAAAFANAETQRETLSLIETLRDAGRGNPFDVARAREQYESTAAQLAGTEGEIIAIRNALDVLVAGLPSEIDLDAPAPVPAPPASFNLGLPEQLLQRRPDIRRARAALEAATARTQAARVDWWPRLSVLGIANWSGANFAGVGDSDGFSFAFGPRIDWPALDVRRNVLRVEAARANAEAEFYRYDQIVFAAVRDVETAFANLESASRSSASLARASEAAQEAARISRLRYREGLEAFFSVLDAERRVAEAQDRLAVAQTRRAVAYARLGQALGVGWRDRQ